MTSVDSPWEESQPDKIKLTERQWSVNGLEGQYLPLYFGSWLSLLFYGTAAELHNRIEPVACPVFSACHCTGRG
jgi:hypothetical protein